MLNVFSNAIAQMYDVDQLLMNVESYLHIADNSLNLFGLAFVLRRVCAGFCSENVRASFGVVRMFSEELRTTSEQRQRKYRSNTGAIRKDVRTI